MAKSAALKKTESSSAQEFEPRIRDARYSVGEDRFVVTFDSGKASPYLRDIGKNCASSGRFSRGSRCAAVILQRAAGFRATARTRKTFFSQTREPDGRRKG